MRSEITAKHAFLYIIKSLKPFPISLFVMFWMAFFWAIDLSIRPYLLKVMLNRVVEGSQQVETLYIPVLLYLLMYFLLASSYRLYDYFVEIKMIPRWREKIANEALGALLDKSHTYYQNNFSGSLTNKVNDLTNSIPEFLQILIERFLSHSLALGIAMYTLWQVSVYFSLFMFCWTAFFISVALLLSKRLTGLADQWSEQGSRITGRIVDALSNILSVRLFSAKQQEKKSLESFFQGAVQAERKLQWSYFLMWLCYGYSSWILQGANFYFLLKGRQEGWVSVGDFALVLILNLTIVDFLWQMAREFSKFSKLLGRITQALKAILSTPDMQDSPQATKLKISEGQIVFDKVHFHYKDTKTLFNNLSLTIKGGQKVGLVGYSGSGKSTFVNLILRLYDVTKGRILIDGQESQTVTQDSLRSAIGMIPQDPSLFHRTLLENIRYGRLDATDEEVIEAAKRAHAHDFISILPEGYHSFVGERGVKLSGGQRQCIAIARVILKNPSILILDEATSQLDSLLEGDIQDSLWKFIHEPQTPERNGKKKLAQPAHRAKTVIAIAHRLSTVLHMDRLLVFEKGVVVQDGTHQELVVQEGLYKDLWEAQVGGFLPEQRKF